MKIQEHIDKISWSFLDKVIFLAYGLVNIVQFNYLDREELGLFALMINIYIWIFVISDAFNLQGLIQFGMNEENKKKVNLISLSLHSSFVIGLSLIVFLFRYPISDFFNEIRFIDICVLLPFLALISIPRTFAVKLLYRVQKLKHVFIADLANFGSMTIITFIIIFQKNVLTFEDMVIIYFGGTIFASIVALLLAGNQLVFSTRGSIKLKEFSKFGSKIMLQAGFHSLPKNLDILFVQYFFFTEMAGIYHSAKTLFRVFDEAVNASYGLVYPTAVRHIERNNMEEVKALMTKALSFMLVAFFVCVLILELGLSHFIFENFLPGYMPALTQYNVLLLTALFLPFTLLSLIITAKGKPEINMLFSAISAAMAIIVLYISGRVQNPDLVPLGLITYNVFFGLLCYIYLKRTIGFPIKLIFRAFSDSLNFYRAFLRKVKK